MKKTIYKLIGILFLVTALVCTQIPVLGTNASSSANNGFMMDGTKLVKYTGTANAVSVPNGVKTIGAEAFSENISLSSISFPSGLETIENGAFSGCTQLRRIVIPEGCTTIENGAFADCDKLEYISIPASLSELGTSVFAGCDRLASVDIADGNVSFICDDGVIYNNKKTVIYQVLAGRTNSVFNMPNTVEEIKKYAFWGCLNLKNVNVSSNLKEIGDYTFSNASALESIVLPYSVRAIRQKAFEDCRHLKDVTIPASVTQIDETAFDGCFSLNIIAESGSAGERFKNDYEASITANMEYEDSVSNNAVTNPVKEQDNKALNIPYASDVEHYVEWDIDSPGVLGRSKIVSGQAVVLMKTDETEILGGENSGIVSDNSTFVLPDGAIVNQNTIGYKAFYCDASISNIQIPGSVRNIDSFAFARSGLTEIDIPYGVTKIENAAFYHCDALEKVTIPNTVSEIGEDAFSHTKWLDNWLSSDDTNDFLIVGDGILLAYKGYADTVNIPTGVKQIGAGVFKNHSEICKVNIPDSTSIICEDAFFNCSSLETVIGMNRVTDIKDRAFYGCPITTVRIPATVCEIGVSAFGGTSKSDSVIFLGNTIPKLSYEESSTRLSVQRNPVFDGIDVAVVDEGITSDSLKNTVLDNDVSGFTGIVFQISDYDAGTASPVLSNKAQDETNMPDNIRVYGKNYTVLPKDSIQYAQATGSISDNSLQDLMNVSHTQWQKKDVSVSQSGSTIDLTGYHLYLSDADDSSLELADAIKQYYGETDDTNCVFFDLSMNDPSNHIPIKQLGKNTISITVSVPSQMIGKDLCVVTLDRNKKPEILFGTLLSKDGKQYVSFDISHFSPFALYVPEGELKNRIVQKNSNSSGLSGLDQTPDTGDYVNIKLILIFGLSALGAFFLVLGFTYPLMRRKKNQS